jgi:CheY-specific phosphatase CheX
VKFPVPCGREKPSQRSWRTPTRQVQPCVGVLGSTAGTIVNARDAPIEANIRRRVHSSQELFDEMCYAQVLSWVELTSWVEGDMANLARLAVRDVLGKNLHRQDTGTCRHHPCIKTQT